AVVVVATIRALKMHGGVAKDQLQHENIEAVEAGLVNLERHVNNIKKYGVEPIVALNAFIHDTPSETACVKQ
ncbi:formate--tetrahydrofolate ligase, partial [Bacillus nitratireducens]